MNDDIERLKALEVAATKGPWYHCRPFETIPPVRTVHGPVPGQRIDYVSTWPGMGTPKDHKVVIPMEGREQTVSSEDMALIVAIRNTLPALLDRLEKAEGELAEAREDVRSLCRFILNEWGPDGALKATTFALEQRQSAKGGDANAAPDRDTNSKSATSPGVTAGASAGWQSIETAPRDGTRFLTWDSYYGVRMGRAFMRADHDDWLSYVDSNGSSHKGGIRASHWMPLPAAPVDGGEDA